MGKKDVSLHFNQVSWCREVLRCTLWVHVATSHSIALMSGFSLHVFALPKVQIRPRLQFNSCVTHWCCRRICKKKKEKKNNSPQGSGEDILEGPELWEFSVKAFQNDSSSTSLNTWSILACWMEWIPLSYCSAVWLSPCYFFPQLQQ